MYIPEAVSVTLSLLFLAASEAVSSALKPRPSEILSLAQPVHDSEFPWSFSSVSSWTTLCCDGSSSKMVGVSLQLAKIANDNNSTNAKTETLFMVIDRWIGIWVYISSSD